MLGSTTSSSSNGSRSTNSSAAAWTGFIHGRVMFAGDTAHQVLAVRRRGAIPASKTPRTWRGRSTACCVGSPQNLLESYHIERSAAADENIRRSTARRISWRRIHQEARLRKAVLSLARKPNSASAWSMQDVSRCRRSTVAAVNRRSRCMAPGGPRPGASMPGCTDYGTLRRSGVSDRRFQQAENGFALLEFGNGAAAETPGRRRNPHRRR